MMKLKELAICTVHIWGTAIFFVVVGGAVAVCTSCAGYYEGTKHLPSKQDRCLRYMQLDAARSATNADAALLDGMEGDDREKMESAISFIIADCRLYLAGQGIVIE